MNASPLSVKTPRALGYRMPAEWEPQEAVWLTWPKDPITWPERVPLVQNIYIRMMEIIAADQTVRLLVDDEQAEGFVRDKLKGAGVSERGIEFWQVPTVDAWIRDYGPTFVVNKNEKQIGMINWIFNAWGNKYEELKEDSDIPVVLNERLGLDLFEPGIVMEGGSIEVDGEGTLLVTEQCQLNPNRNPAFSREEIETILQEYLNVQKILWLGDGIEGDDTDGHIDDITRFAAPGVLVTAVEPDYSDANHVFLAENLRRLRSMTDAKGRAFEIAELPMPGRVATPERRLPASYANFLITNKTVLVPVFEHKNDARALAVLRELFPTREVVGLSCEPMVWGLGAIHCLSQHQPAI